MSEEKKKLEIVTDEELLRFGSLDVEKKEMDWAKEQLKLYEEWLKPVMVHPKDETEREVMRIRALAVSSPQFGVYKKITCIRIPKEVVKGAEEDMKYDFINPVIADYDTAFIYQHEGCLSFPKVYFNTLRYRRVLVKDALRPSGIILMGLSSVVAQHEIDHLSGILYFDRKKQSIDRNELCPCGSKKKAKKCCLLRD